MWTNLYNIFSGPDTLTIFFRMPPFDDTHVVFRDDAQRRRYATLSTHLMIPTQHPDPNCMEVLGIEESVKYLCNQLQWEEYAGDVNVTYRYLTLEFLSSLDY